MKPFASFKGTWKGLLYKGALYIAPRSFLYKVRCIYDYYKYLIAIFLEKRQGL